MNIIWSQSEKVFLAEFSQDFQGDLEAVKSAGFRTTGPPEWRWYAPAPGIKQLNKLRQNRPASGLTISQEALTIYQSLAELEAKNDVVKAQLAENKKKAKKERKQKQQSLDTIQVPEGKQYIGQEDLPPMPPYVPSYIIPDIPFTGFCLGCGSRLYMYESKDFCHYCENQKITLDNMFDL